MSEIDPGLLQGIADTIWDKKGFAVDIRHVTDIVGYTDYMVLCTANSERHANAIADYVVVALREKFGEKPIGHEGKGRGHWVLLDYGNFIIHIFAASVRDYYELDRLYGDADRVALEEPEEVRQGLASGLDWQEGAPGDALSVHEVAEDYLAEDALAEDALAEDDLAEDALAEDDLAKDEAYGDVSADEELAGIL